RRSSPREGTRPYLAGCRPTSGDVDVHIRVAGDLDTLPGQGGRGFLARGSGRPFRRRRPAVARAAGEASRSGVSSGELRAQVDPLRIGRAGERPVPALAFAHSKEPDQANEAACAVGAPEDLVGQLWVWT